MLQLITAEKWVSFSFQAEEMITEANGRASAQITNTLVKQTKCQQSKMWGKKLSIMMRTGSNIPICNIISFLQCLSCLWSLKKKSHLWASRFMGYCEDMIIIVCLPSLPRSPYYSREHSKPPGISWKWSDFEGSKKEAESNALVCEKGAVIETSTSYMPTLSSINTVLHTVTMDFHSNDWETAYTIITETHL